MFDLFKAKEPQSTNGLFLVGVKVARGTNAEMPSQLVGAIVPVFAAAASHKLAAKAAVSKLVSQGFEFLDIQGPIKQLDPQQWSSYVHHTWPEFEAHFPRQQEVLAGVASGAVFFGPFAGYEGA
jgi:hypothetical protein